MFDLKKNKKISFKSKMINIDIFFHHKKQIFIISSLVQFVGLLVCFVALDESNCLKREDLITIALSHFVTILFYLFYLRELTFNYKNGIKWNVLDDLFILLFFSILLLSFLLLNSYFFIFNGEKHFEMINFISKTIFISLFSSVLFFITLKWCLFFLNTKCKMIE